MANNQTRLKALCLEDVPNDAELLKEMLTDSGYDMNIDVAEDEEKFTSSLKTATYDIIFADYTLPGFNGLEALELARILQPNAPFIFISGTIGEDKAVELVKQGATDYVLKDRLGRLVFSVTRALNDAANLKEWRLTQDKLHDKEIIEIQNGELRKLNATKDKFFSIIAHDLRSPFNSIMGFSQMLMDKAHQLDKENIERMAQIINEASKLAMDLLTNLTDWSLSQSGRIEFHPEEILIADVVKEVEPLFAPAAIQKSIEIKTEVQSQLTAYADEVLLHTILRNLICNAIKFTRTGGEITISSKAWKNQVIISVSDTGVGISESKIQDLFRIDKNFSTEGTNKEKGTGLGLILCRELVEKHGGRIWAESKEGEGSTFSFSLPNIKE
jgi:two-component system, sensor histidine kinase and response regulator